jgi:hypothetical protein
MRPYHPHTLHLFIHGTIWIDSNVLLNFDRLRCLNTFCFCFSIVTLREEFLLKNSPIHCAFA